MLNIPQNEIHLWLVKDQEVIDENLLDTYQALLNSEEQERYQRFIFAKHKQQFLLTRALVRCVLAKYLPDTIPEELVFSKNQYGKPEINNAKAEPVIQFNLSHTQNLVVLAVSQTAEVGVDVEYMNRQVEALELAERFFSEAEASDLKRVTAAQRNEAFFDLWTLKEAYIKACGMGLEIPLRDFSFSFQGGKISIEFAQQRNDSPRHWLFWQFLSDSGHKISLALKTEKPAKTFKLISKIGVPQQGFEEIDLAVTRIS